MSFDPPQGHEPAFAMPGAADRVTGFEALRETGIYGFDSKDMRSRPFTLLRAQILRIARRNWSWSSKSARTFGTFRIRRTRVTSSFDSFQTSRSS